jgi:hypothetical protein
MKPVTFPPGRGKLATKPLPDRIDNVPENDGDGARLLQQRGRRGCGLRKNEVGLSSKTIGMVAMMDALIALTPMARTRRNLLEQFQPLAGRPFDSSIG